MTLLSLLLSRNRPAGLRSSDSNCRNLLKIINYHISKSGDVMHIVAVDSRWYICKGVANQPPGHSILYLSVTSDVAPVTPVILFGHQASASKLFSDDKCSKV